MGLQGLSEKAQLIEKNFTWTHSEEPISDQERRECYEGLAALLTTEQTKQIRFSDRRAGFSNNQASGNLTQIVMDFRETTETDSKGVDAAETRAKAAFKKLSEPMTGYKYPKNTFNLNIVDPKTPVIANTVKTHLIVVNNVGELKSFGRDQIASFNQSSSTASSSNTSAVSKSTPPSSTSSTSNPTTITFPKKAKNLSKGTQKQLQTGLDYISPKDLMGNVTRIEAREDQYGEEWLRSDKTKDYKINNPSTSIKTVRVYFQDEQSRDAFKKRLAPGQYVYDADRTPVFKDNKHETDFHGRSADSKKYTYQERKQDETGAYYVALNPNALLAINPDKIEQHRATAHTFITEEIEKKIEEFLDDSMQNGTAVEKTFYATFKKLDGNWDIQKYAKSVWDRRFDYFYMQDDYAAKDGKRLESLSPYVYDQVSEQWVPPKPQDLLLSRIRYGAVDITTLSSEVVTLSIENTLTDKEIRDVGSLIGASVKTTFHDTGERFNEMGNPDIPESHPFVKAGAEGYAVFLTGARMENKGLAEAEIFLITKDHTAENGYGADGWRTTELALCLNRFGIEPKELDYAYVKNLYEQNRAEFDKRFIAKAKTDNYGNVLEYQFLHKAGYEARLKMVLPNFVQESARIVKEEQKTQGADAKGYLRVPGIGHGVWSKGFSNEIGDMIGAQMSKIAEENVDLFNECFAAVDWPGKTLVRPNHPALKTEFLNYTGTNEKQFRAFVTEKFLNLSRKYKKLILIAGVGWDGACKVGNEYHAHVGRCSDDPAATLCSDTAETLAKPETFKHNMIIHSNLGAAPKAKMGATAASVPAKGKKPVEGPKAAQPAPTAVKPAAAVTAPTPTSTPMQRSSQPAAVPQAVTREEAEQVLTAMTQKLDALSEKYIREENNFRYVNDDTPFDLNTFDADAIKKSIEQEFQAVSAECEALIQNRAAYAQALSSDDASLTVAEIKYEILPTYKDKYFETLQVIKNLKQYLNKLNNLETQINSEQNQNGTFFKEQVATLQGNESYKNLTNDLSAFELSIFKAMLEEKNKAFDKACDALDGRLARQKSIPGTSAATQRSVAPIPAPIAAAPRKNSSDFSAPLPPPLVEPSRPTAGTPAAIPAPAAPAAATATHAQNQKKHASFGLRLAIGILATVTVLPMLGFLLYAAGKTIRDYFKGKAEPKSPVTPAKDVEMQPQTGSTPQGGDETEKSEANAVVDQKQRTVINQFKKGREFHKNLVEGMTFGQRTLNKPKRK